MKVLIVEDEPFAQQELIRLLEKVATGTEVIACLDSVEDTVEWLRENPVPDLIFLDIQLSDGLSFEIFKQEKVMCPVIFTTAFDEYSIQAFKVNSIDYLLKPIKTEDLQAALNKFEDVRKSYQSGLQMPFDISKLELLLKPVTKEYKSRFIARVGDQIRHLGIDEISWFYAEDNVVFLITRTNHRYIIDYTLDQIMELIDPAVFTRLNRSVIAHISGIGKVSRYFNGRLLVEMIPASPEPTYVSRAKAQSFIEWLDK